MIMAAGLAQLPEKLGRSGVAASRAWQGLDHYAPNRHDIGSTTARSVHEVALIQDTISHYAPVLIAPLSNHSSRRRLEFFLDLADAKRQGSETTSGAHTVAEASRPISGK